MSVNEKIISLINLKYLEKLPVVAYEHAISGACEFLQTKFPLLHEKLSNEEDDEDVKNEVSKIVNDLFLERLKKHNLM